MSINRGKTVRLLIRTTAVLAAGIMVSIAFLANMSTHSWFISSAMGSASVITADTLDIIEDIELLSDDGGKNAAAIRIRKAEDIDYAPLVYFSVEGEAADYILHINPVRLEENSNYIIPIETDVNLNQFAELLCRKDNITGTLRIKYLNEYIDESYDISFSPKYLMNRLMAKIVKEGAKPEKEKNMMRMLTFIEPPEGDSESLTAHDTESITIKAIASLAELVEWKHTDSMLEGEELTYEALYPRGLKLTSNQEFLMDIMYPGLKEYVEGLKGCIAKLRAEIEEKNAQLARLDEQLSILESQYEQLMEENARLTEQINSMASVQPPAILESDTTQPPAAGGGSPQGDGGTPDDSSPDAGTAPDDGTPGGDTEDRNTGDADTDTGDAGDSSTVDSGAGTGDAGDSSTVDSGAGTGDAGDSSTVDSVTGTGDAEDSDTVDSGTGTGDEEDNDTGSTETGTDDTGIGNADDESGEPADNNDAPEEPPGSGGQEAIVGGSEEEDNIDDVSGVEEDTDTTDEGETGSSDGTDEGVETNEAIRGE